MPVAFEIDRTIQAPPPFVHHWWMENGPSFEIRVRDGVRQERTRKDPYHLTVKRWTRHSGRDVYLEAEMEVNDVSSWSCRKTTSVNGVLFIEETVRYYSEAVSAGCRLRVAFEIHGPTLVRRGLLRISRGRLTRHRAAELDRAIRELERERASPAG
ncbi:MAG: hypothetical protein L3K19_05280 [Thermoplasmata archaeon]|nr:hypothetical protein [Thermoplasmata archaeon]